MKQNGTNAVPFGGSFKLSAKTFDTSGKPTDTKLKWDIARVYNQSSIEIDPAKYKNLITVNQSGVLTVKKAAADLKVRSVTVRVRPANYLPWTNPETNVTDLSAGYIVNVIEPIKKIAIDTTELHPLTAANPEFSTSVVLNDDSLPAITRQNILFP